MDVIIYKLIFFSLKKDGLPVECELGFITHLYGPNEVAVAELLVVSQEPPSVMS